MNAHCTIYEHKKVSDLTMSQENGKYILQLTLENGNVGKLVMPPQELYDLMLFVSPEYVNKK